MDYDVIVVGAGPVGSTFARDVAKKGFKVAILEKKREIGKPLQCAGILGNSIRNVNKLPKSVIINEVSGANIYSPNLNKLYVTKNETQGYIIDRIKYDEYLSKEALNNGVDILFKHKVVNVDPKRGMVSFKNSGDIHKLSARIIVGADGPNSVVAKCINSHSEHMNGVQYLIKLNEIVDIKNVNLYFNEYLAPGFKWAIPLDSLFMRFGCVGNYDYKTLNIQLNNLLKIKKEENPIILEKYFGKIPIFNSSKKIYDNRVLLLGDAAAQTKPTTGGGLVLAFKASKFAVDVVEQNLEQNNNANINLKNYYNLCKKDFFNELRVQKMVSNVFSSLTDDDLENMFDKLKEKNVENIISDVGDIDSQSILVKKLFRKGIVSDILPTLLYRSVLKFQNFL